MVIIKLACMILITLWGITVEARSLRFPRPLDRYSFPTRFIFGVGSSAYQFEGAIKEGGRTQSMWDNFTHAYPERTNMDNGDVAVDFYHRYKLDPLCVRGPSYDDDIKLIKKMNMDSFRFSISWTRILPSGRLRDGVNEEGVKFYKNLIDELIANDIQPLVTIYHWDLPQALEDEYGGFLSPQIINDYRDFARVCFQEFGDKVKLWTTFNEPYVYSVSGYDTGIKAMGRCSKWVNSECQAGDSGTEPYIVSHHLLLAHAAAFQEFKKCHKTYRNGKIGIVLSPLWFEPYDTASPADKEAIERALAYNLGWHLDPLVYGDYPETMKRFTGDRLPSFTEEQSKMVKNSFDFIGVNYYTTRFVASVLDVDPTRPRFTTDQHVELRLKNVTGDFIGPEDDMKSIYLDPDGLRKILNYIKDKYNHPTIYITENGFDQYDNGAVSVDEILKDTMRIEYHNNHLQQLHKAIVEDGCDVRGYFVWSFLDNFEWEKGYSVRFGLYYVDYQNDLKRYPKDSAKWFTQFLERSKHTFQWFAPLKKLFFALQI